MAALEPTPDLAAVRGRVMTRMLTEARWRVLTRFSGQARKSAERIREHAAANGHNLASAEHVAAGLERYADECDTAALDPALPTPEYLTEEKR